MVHLQEESLIIRSLMKTPIDLFNLISTTIRVLVHQGQQRLHTMYTEQKMIFEFDRNDLHLVKSFYDLNPTKEQILHIQKLWRLKVKACKRTIHEFNSNSMVPSNQNAEVNIQEVYEEAKSEIDAFDFPMNQPINKQFSLECMNGQIRTIIEARLMNIERRREQIIEFKRNSSKK
ncbi:unnamed protein product [Rotaria magnacalcarata]|uniref:Uncharacterized protein n=1 Tax=Rotaria magnacalcarata TaxID=392030 RepID=A0A815YQE6_9BILA|nr:unnamed protein product [Rotaria magnacalcarata]CAF1572899.1 unnamed protein product [Rotaria magnacalcarata]CAF2156063.1 unnamed protein product [Rotaria magnacalcarata]CAF3802305.1 unnamed protein product [Rotaria magnacalcarata]CAF3909199.1 unnamed protein product [Rotaria magnacalcarata]